MNKLSKQSIPTQLALVAAAAAVLLLNGCGQPEVADLLDGGVLAADIKIDTYITDVKVKVDTVTAVEDSRECDTDFDCSGALGKTPCNLPTCTAGVCGWTLKKLGSVCTDPTLSGTACEIPRCSETGICALQDVGSGNECDSNNGKEVGECQITVCNDKKKCVLRSRADKTKCGQGFCGNWCSKGECASVPNTEYDDDNNPCTLMYCDQNTAIKTELITSTKACDDGLACTGDGTCVKGVCTAKTTGKECDDGLACTKDSCDKVGGTGCVHTANDSECTDSTSCFNMACDLAAGCTATTAKTGEACDDGDKCTTKDSCDKDGTCGSSTNVCACKADVDCDQTDLCLPRVCDLTDPKKGVCIIDAGKRIVCDKASSSTCGVNSCDPKTGTCELKPLNEGNDCKDGKDLCVSKTVCEKGACTGSADVKCDDGNPCTIDSCDAATGCKAEAVPGACDDGNPCTADDACVDGGCAGQDKPCDDGVSCTFDSCDPKTGKCINKTDDMRCNDKNPCTADTCDASEGCKNVADDKATCDDKNDCTTTACKSGLCVVTDRDTTIVGCACEDNKGCDDNNPCTADICEKGNCTYSTKPLEGKACLGSNLCIEGSTCSAGACTGGKKRNCTDGKPCTSDGCDAGTGKCFTTAKANGTKCDADGSLCTANDTCKNGGCIAGTQKDCSASADACNLAVCAATTGKCAKEPKKKGLDCDDGVFCTDKDTCDGKGSCVSGPAKVCGTAGNSCSTSVCDETKKACTDKPLPLKTMCDDGQGCTVNDFCNGKGDCSPGKPKSCGTKLGFCKTGYCNYKSGKCATKPAPAGTSCSDGNSCTLTDKCSSTGSCVGGSNKECAGDQCNVGLCDAKTGACTKKPKTDKTKCNDSLPCTQLDVCSKGKCTGTKPKICSGNACNTGICVAKTGACSTTPKKPGTLCNDGNSCTAGDFCSSGVCKAGPKYTCKCKTITQAADCNDKNSCTKDTCSLAGVCKNTIMVGAECSDGQLCTNSDACSKFGTCVGKKVYCKNDGNVCTRVNCSPSNGKCATKVLFGYKCSDGKLCTTNDRCNSKGTCTGKVPVCDDGNICTTTAGCSSKTGKCVFLNNSSLCDDGNACTQKDICSLGKCRAGKLKICTDATKCTLNSCNTKTGACVTKPVYENSTCEKGKYSICASGGCYCRLWVSLYGGPSYDYIYGMAKASNLGTVSVGMTYVSLKSYEGYIMSHSKTGKVLWAKTISGGPGYDRLNAVTATKTAGVYLAVGYRYYNSTYNNVGWMVWFDQKGNILKKKYDTIKLSTKSDSLTDVLHDGAGNYYAVGTTYGKNGGYASGWLTKLNSTGAVVWNKTREGIVGKTRYRYYFNAITRYNTLIYAAGTTSQTKYGSNDGVICRYDTNGNLQFTRMYGSKGSDTLNGAMVYGSSLYFVGQSYNSANTKNGYDAWLLRINTSGTQYVSKLFGSTRTDAFYDIDSNGSNVFAVGSYSDPKTGRTRGYAVRANSSGYKYGEYKYGHASYNTTLYAIEDNSSTTYYTVAGTTTQGNQTYVARTLSTGSTACKTAIIKLPVGGIGAL